MYTFLRAYYWVCINLFTISDVRQGGGWLVICHVDTLYTLYVECIWYDIYINIIHRTRNKIITTPNDIVCTRARSKCIYSNRWPCRRRHKWLKSIRQRYYWIRSRVNGSDFELRSGRDVILRGMSWIREKVVE